jgi:hypothetical protein
MSLYIYPIEPGLFKFGAGRLSGDTFSYAKKLIGNYSHDERRLVRFDVSALWEDPIRDYLIAKGHQRVRIPMRLTRAKENSRTAKEVHRLAGRTFEEVVAMINVAIKPKEGRR